MRFLKKLFGRERKEPVISKEEALEIAKKFAEEKQWPWHEPVCVSNANNTWYVTTNIEAKGFRVCIDIDDQTGEVTKGHTVPR